MATAATGGAATPAAPGPEKHEAVENTELQLARVEEQAKHFFDALKVSSTNVSQLGKNLLEEIKVLEKTLDTSGATGLSLLVGSEDINDEAAVTTKLKELEESFLQGKEKERVQMHDAIQVVQTVFPQK